MKTPFLNQFAPILAADGLAEGASKAMGIVMLTGRALVISMSAIILPA